MLAGTPTFAGKTTNPAHEQISIPGRCKRSIGRCVWYQQAICRISAAFISADSVNELTRCQVSGDRCQVSGLGLSGRYRRSDRLNFPCDFLWCCLIFLFGGWLQVARCLTCGTDNSELQTSNFKLKTSN